MSPFLALLVIGYEAPTATVKMSAATVAVGKPVRGILTLVLPRGTHGYQNPPADPYENPIRLSVAEVGFKLVKIEYPKGTDMRIAGAETPSKVYEGTVTIPFTLVATRPSPKGATTNVNFRVAYQLCTASTCYPPATLALKASLKVTK